MVKKLCSSTFNLKTVKMLHFMVTSLIIFYEADLNF